MPTLSTTSQKPQHGTWIEIHTDSLLSNLKAINQKLGSEVQALAVVKANAYGHGAVGISRVLSGKVAYLGVSNIQEALELREHGIKTPLFLFGGLLQHEIRNALVDGITLSVSSFEEAKFISESSTKLNRKTPIHIKVDTGMGRFGIPFRDAVREIEKIAPLPGLLFHGIYTHFPAAESLSSFTKQQNYEFSLVVDALAKKAIHFVFRHAANSAGCVRVEHSSLNLARPGLMLYGVYPTPSLKSEIALKPVLTLKSRVVFLKKLLSDQSVGYSREFIASKPMTMGILPIGYSHGYPLRAWENASVLYRGQRLPVIGKISMDYLCVDFGNLPVQMGEEVTLIGSEGNETIRIEDLAKWAGTIPYEIMTRLMPRIPRLYEIPESHSTSPT